MNAKPVWTRTLAVLGIVSLVLLAGCGGGASSGVNNPPPPPTPTTSPTITSISPNAVASGGASFTLTVSGRGFDSRTGEESLLQWGDTLANATVSSNGQQLTATIPASLIANSGNVLVSVCNCNNADLVGPVSNTATLVITTPPQTISAILPSSATAGGARFTLTVNGSGFASASVVRWNDSDRVTTFISSTQLTTSVPSSDIASGGIAQVRVFNDVPGGGTSNSAAFAISAPSGAGSIERVSVASDGTQSNGDSFIPAVSGDGRLVAFQSSASNLVAGDTNGVPDVFLRDTCLGVPAGCTPSTVRVSMASDGTQGNGLSGSPTVFGDTMDRVASSATGRFFAFASQASNLVADDTNKVDDVFLRDTCIAAPVGCTPSTARVSVKSDGSQLMFPSGTPSLSADGRFVAFVSVIQVDSSGGFLDQQIFVRDTCFGALPSCTPTTTMVSVTSDGTPVSSFNFAPGLSADGRFVVFNAGIGSIFVRDTCFNALGSCTPSTNRVSVKSDGSQLTSGFDAPAISAGGRFVAFVVGGATDPSIGVLISSQVFVRDTCAGASGCTPSTILTFDGGASVAAFQPSLSADGRFMAIQIQRADLTYQIRVLDTCEGAPAGCLPSTILSVDTANGLASQPSLSADGRFVAFASSADNLVAGDTNKSVDIFLVRTGH
jgi:Tol biopolymer transport system component